MFLFHPREAVAAGGVHLFVDDKLPAAASHLQRQRIFAVAVEDCLADGAVEGELPVELGFLRHGQGQGLDRFGRAFEVVGELEPDLHLLDARGGDHPHLVPVAARVPGFDPVAEVAGGGGDGVVAAAVG